jgi:ferredoxin
MMRGDADELRVWVDQDLCTGDGLCVQYAPDVFEFDVDGLAYVKDHDGVLQLTAGARARVPAELRLHVIDAARDCPGECIHVVRATDGAEVASPDETDQTDETDETGRATQPARSSDGR